MLWDANMTMDDLKKRQEEYKKQALEMAKRSQVKVENVEKVIKVEKVETISPQKIEQSKSVETDSAQKKTTISSPVPQSNDKSPQPSQVSEQTKRADWIRTHSIEYQIGELRAKKLPYQSRTNSKKPQPTLDKLLKPCPTLQNNYTQRLRSTAAVSRQR